MTVNPILKLQAVNQNNKLKEAKTETLQSRSTAQSAIICFGFVTTSDHFHFTHRHLTDCLIKNINRCSFNLLVAFVIAGFSV